MQTPHDQGTRTKAWKAIFPNGTPPTDVGIASSGITFHLWRLYQHAWLVCLLFPLVSLGREPFARWRLTLGLLALLFFATSYTWLMWPHPASQRARVRTRSHCSLILLVALSLLVLALSLVDGPAWLWLFIGVSAIAGGLLPMRSAFAVVMLLTLLPLFMLIIVGVHAGQAQGDWWWWLIALMLLIRGLGLDMIGVARMGSAIRDLHTAQRELARLKVEEERLRVARDLHDLLGHTLSLITLKSKLAGRLIEQEPARAAQEIREVERIARQTLREVREAVAGYRQPTLANEVDGAQQMLEAAGIACSLEDAKLPLPSGIDTVLAWTVREGVTNVIRHSRAQHCVIRLYGEDSMVCVQVRNDGEPRVRTEGAEARAGLGLSGLTERVTSLGGWIKAGSVQTDGKTGFCLEVELPLESQGESRATAQEEFS